MKKSFKFSVMLILCAMITVFSTVIVRADYMVVSGGGTYGIGDTVTITVQFYGDIEIYAYDGYLTYDDSVLYGQTSFADGWDGSNYAYETISLTVVGYGDTEISVSGNYSDGAVSYQVSDYTYVSVPTPAPDEPQEGSVVTDAAEDDYNGYQEDEVQPDVDEIAVTDAPESENITTANENKVDVDGVQMNVVSSFTSIETVDDKDVSVTNPILSELPVLNGFTLTTTELNGNNVDVYQVEDIVDVYVLTDENNANADYYTYDQKTKKFKKLAYGTYNSRTFAILDVPEDVSLNNYEKKEITINGGKITAFQAKGAANANADTLANASPSDFYIVYAVADGSAGYYSYDQKDMTMQRLNSGFVDGIVKEEVTTAANKVETQAVVPSYDSSFNGLPKFYKLLIILLIVIIIALAGTMIVFLPRKKKTDDRKKTGYQVQSVKSVYVVDEDYSPMDIDYNGQEPGMVGKGIVTEDKNNDGGE